MKIILCLMLTFLAVNGNPVESDRSVEPEYLDQLLAEGRYEEFSEIMGIPDPKFVQERKMEERGVKSRDEAMYNPELLDGDIMPSTKEELEEVRQGIRFEKYTGSRWSTRVVPYVISGQFNARERNIIEEGVRHWNGILYNCVRLKQRTNERDYVFIFSGDGCWSNQIGRKGDQQTMSLNREGCLHRGVVLHEFEHVVGFTHEQNRSDRDNFIEMLWNNIPDRWKGNYVKTNPDDFNLLQRYDYYSVMHYPVNVPGSNRPAFRVKQNGVNQRNIGQRNSFTGIDVAKIKNQYGCR